MKYLGIDYGKKRIGIAVSDIDGKLAFPKMVLDNNKDTISQIKKFCDDEKIGKIVIGESKAFSGEDNPVQSDIAMFTEELKKNIELAIISEPEFLTSVQAQRAGGDENMLDASASAIILQSYLDKL